MAFIERDANGKIIALRAGPDRGADEEISSADPEVLEFLAQSESDDASLDVLTTSDIELVRVLEDLIELLVDKNLLLFTELPEAAQRKLMARKQARAVLADDGSPMVSRDEVL